MSLIKSKQSIDDAILLLKQMESQIEIYKHMIARLTDKHGFQISQEKMDLEANMGFRFRKLGTLDTEIVVDRDEMHNFKERVSKLINQ